MVSTLPDQAKILAAYESIPLEEILKFLVKQSDNLYAEMICRQLGLMAGRHGSRLEARAGLEDFLKKAGVAQFSGHLADGSGLSKSNLISPKMLTQLLDFMRTHASHTSFFQLLPIAGVDGTMKYRLTQSSATGKIFAKTGTLNTANSLSGYAKTTQGEELIFSIMVNNFTGETHKVRDVIDRICEVMVDHRDPLDTK
jgi:D-alanyl-D-alanine carboxypeptidase/D-alanyl-D-alanine-endopeptidase (penicillin-binding protein 4)